MSDPLDAVITAKIKEHDIRGYDEPWAYDQGFRDGVRYAKEHPDE